MSQSGAVVKVNAPAKRPVRILPHIDDREFLPAALEIIDTPPSPAAILLSIVLCALTAAAIAWCWFGRLDIYATARGKIEPAGHAKVVQPLDTGKIASVEVEEGRTVKAGDILFVLDTSDARAEVAADTQAMLAERAESLRRRTALAAVGAGFTSGATLLRWAF